ncbi:MAG: DUF169 domain-containing protein [Desulfovibrionaceae bacterium]|nr:DUF169 domain-containing protein [Desulfovibrionaceae bacterium]
MPLSYAVMEKTLMDELRLYHHPVAVSWLFTDQEVEAFRTKHDCVVPVKATTFCQWEIAARMQNKTVLAFKEQLGCSNAQVSFGFKENDDKEYKSQLKYCKDLAQAERFQLSKPRLPLGTVKAVGVGPLGKAALPPHVVHFYCDNMQSYHLAVDYMAATDTHPLRPQITISSSACGGSVFTWQQQSFNCSPACSGSYNSGKTERGEVNVFIPGEHIEAVVKRLLQRIEQSGSSALTRPGDPFPGGDICKNCPLIIFKADACNTCGQ